VVVDETWAKLQATKQWPHQSWCEAHIFGRFILCYWGLQARRYLDVIAHVDMALILGAPAEVCEEIIRLAETDLAVEVSPHLNLQLELEQPTSGFPSDGPQIAKLGALSVAQFSSQCYSKRQPTVLCDSITHWSALKQWRDLGWLAKEFGHRTVPVEVGRHHGGAWLERTMTIGNFLEEYLIPDAKCFMESGGAARMPDDQQVGYIAQHPLFEQLPGLRRYFRTPSLCNVGEQGLQKMNAWIGTSGTVTPLHYDSYDNFLAQVVGYKYVRLYSPDETDKLYLDAQPEGEVTYAQNNISPVNIEAPDLTQHPKFKDAKYCEAVLAPGELLFIPQGWWHYVRSLSPSMSVNFWF